MYKAAINQTRWTLEMMFVMSGYVQSSYKSDTGDFAGNDNAVWGSYKSDTVDFADDVVRDVWLCAGQL